MASLFWSRPDWNCAIAEKFSVINFVLVWRSAAEASSQLLLEERTQKAAINLTAAGA